jgi:hypothetical protein
MRIRRALTTLAAAALGAALAFPASPASAAGKVFDHTQWHTGYIAFVNAWCGYGNCIAFEARVDWQSMSATKLATPKAGERFMMHLLTANIAPGGMADNQTFQMGVLLPAGLVPSIKASTDVKCYITDADDVPNGRIMACPPPTKYGLQWRFPAVSLSGNETAHIFFPVVASKQFVGTLGYAGSNPSYPCSSHWDQCVQMVSNNTNNTHGFLPNPMVSWVPLRVQGVAGPAPLSAPRSAAGSPRSKAAVVSWAAPAGTGGSRITAYTVVAAPGGRSCTTTRRACTVTGLLNGRSYRFSVRVRTAAGKTSAAARTAPVVVGTPTPVRSLRVAFPAAGTALISWVKPASLGSGAITRYEARAQVYNPSTSSWTAWSKWTSVGRRTSDPERGVQVGLQVRFQVRAVNASGASLPAQVAFTQPI